MAHHCALNFDYVIITLLSYYHRAECREYYNIKEIARDTSSATKITHAFNQHTVGLPFHSHSNNPLSKAYNCLYTGTS